MLQSLNNIFLSLANEAMRSTRTTLAIVLCDLICQSASGGNFSIVQAAVDWGDLYLQGPAWYPT